MSGETIRWISFSLTLAYLFVSYIYLLGKVLKLSELSTIGTSFTKILSTPFWRTEKIKLELKGNEALRNSVHKIEREMTLLACVGFVVVLVNVAIFALTRQ
jgi:hypothetical protein